MVIAQKLIIGCGSLCVGSGVLFVLLVVALCVVIDVRDMGIFQGDWSSDSMRPTVEPGEWMILDRKATPKIGDIISFRCAHEDTLCFRIYGTDRIEHRWVSSLPNGCMYIIGDNPEYATTWKRLPCFPPEDIVIEGVSHKLWF